jgi:Na+/proline symporter
MGTGTVGYVVFGIYLLTMVLIGLLAGREQHRAADLWVAGRRFGLLVMILGLMASVMHGGSILSGVAFAGAFGGVAILPFVSFAAGFLVILLFFARKLRLMGAFTISDFMAERYASQPLRAFTAIVVLTSSVVYLIAQIRGMGFLLQGLLGFSPETSMAVGTLLFVFYVALGGMLAVIWTNIAQFIFMWIGLLVTLPAVVNAVGGWTEALQRAEAVAPGWTSVLGTSWSWGYLLSWWLVWFVAYATRIELVTKVFIARDANIARFALPTTCVLVMMFLLYGNLYLGAAARVTVWDQLRTPDQAFPALLHLLLPPTLTAIALTGIASAAMSTTDSLLLLSGAAVAHDLLRKCHDEPRGIVRDERTYLVASRGAIVGVGVLAFVGALRTPELILAIVSYAVAMVGSAFFFPLLFGLTSRRVTPAAALASSVGGFSITVLWTAWTLAGSPTASAVHPIVPGLAVSLLLILVVTPLSRPAPDTSLAKFFEVRSEPAAPQHRRV